MTEYQLPPDAPLARLAPTPDDIRSIMATHARLPECERFSLSTPPLVSEYGVIGLAVIDSRPGLRWASYTESDKLGLTWKERDLGGFDCDPTHYVDTDRGFAIGRFIVLPDACVDFLAKDRFLGPAAIRKCCEDNTTPDALDEMLMRPDYYHGADRDDRRSGDPIGLGIPIVREVLRAANANPASSFQYTFEEAGNTMTLSVGLEAYVSFHRWPALNTVQEQIRQSILQTLWNFDDLLSKFDRARALVTEPCRVLKVDPPPPSLP